MATLLLTLAYTFIPASMIVFIIKEREYNSKHQQLVSGVNLFAYWLSNFIVDYCKYLIPAMFTYVMIFAFKLKFWYDGDKGSFMFLLLIFYGICFLPFIYLISFKIRKPSSGQVLIFLLCFFCGIILMITFYVLKLIKGTRSITDNVLLYIVRLIPFFSFPISLLMVGQTKVLKLVYDNKKENDAFTKEVALVELIYMILLPFVFWGLIFLIENAKKLGMKGMNLGGNKFMEEVE